MMLASAVASQNGALVIFGAGWMVRPPNAQAAGPSAVACVVRVPRDQAGEHQLRLELLDSDDEIVVINPPDGPGPMIFEAQFPTGGLDRPDITVPVTAPVAFNLPPFPLARGSQFRWRAFVDGETRESWSLPFRTTPPKSPNQ
jgi:hypothetical protein